MAGAEAWAALAESISIFMTEATTLIIMMQDVHTTTQATTGAMAEVGQTTEAAMEMRAGVPMMEAGAEAEAVGAEETQVEAVMGAAVAAEEAAVAVEAAEGAAAAVAGVGADDNSIESQL